MLSLEEMKRVAGALRVPLQANLWGGRQDTDGALPGVVIEAGFKLISYSGTLQRTAIRGMQDVLDVLKRDGSTNAAYPEKICNLAERSAVLGLEQFYELEERLYGPIMDTEGSWRKELQKRTQDQTAATSTPRI